MSLSVILPNFNHARWLPRALSALVQQSCQPDQIIVVDDGSTDDSVEIIQKFKKQYAFIELDQHATNQGAEAAVKTALEHATGDLLLFAAADDFVLPGLLAQGASALRDNPEAAFFCSEVALVDSHDKIIGFRPIITPRKTPGYVSPNEVRRAIRRSDGWFIGTSVIYRHGRLAEIGYFDSSLGTLQDAMATRLLAFRHGFYFSPEVLATWRVIPDSLSVVASLSLSDNEQLLSKSKNWITTHFPADVKSEYPGLFERRLRFNFARARLVWRGARRNTDAIADILKFGRFDRLMLRLASYLPIGSSPIILVWVTLRARPYAFSHIVAYACRRIVANRSRRARLTRLIEARQSDPRPAA
jgi:glycosyltransferase involved in cell wall biosynthesis